MSRAQVAREGIWAAAPWITMFMIAIVTVRLHEVVPFIGVFRPALLATGLGLGLLVFAAPVEAKREALGQPAFRVFVALWGWAILGVPFALWKAEAFNTCVSIFPPMLVMFFAVIVLPPSPQIMHRLLSAFVLSLGLLVVLARKLNIRVEATGRLSLPVGDPNEFALLLAAGFPCALALGLRSRGWRRWAFLGIGGVLLYGILQTQSRGGMLAVGTASIVLLVGLGKSQRLWALGLMLAGGAALVVNSPEAVLNRLSTVRNLEQDYNANEYTGRAQIWRRGIGYTLANPIFGVGAGSFPTAEGMTLRKLGRTGKWSAAHNSYIQAFAELGLPGGALFVTVLVLGLRGASTVFRKRRRAPGRLHAPELTAGLIGVMVGAFFLSQAYGYVIYFLVGMGVFAARVGRQYVPPVPVAPPPPPPPRPRPPFPVKRATVRQRRG